ncbi:MAG: glutathione S-transferase family protein [Kordiimonadaceae bacterium]|nr:glutathione S-transferase family protein [Kordiimonadaceae bacterium]
MTIQLFGASVSPYYERVLVFLDMKGALDQVELCSVPGGFKSGAHIEHHPLGMIPFLIKEDGSSLTESQLIMLYLDSVLIGPKQLPVNIDAAIQTQAIARVFDLYYGAAVKPFGAAYFGGEVDEAAMETARGGEIQKVFGYVEKYMDGGQHAVGTDWTMADAVLIVQLYWYHRIGQTFELPALARFPKLKSYWENINRCDYALRSIGRIETSYNNFSGKPS